MLIFRAHRNIIKVHTRKRGEKMAQKRIGRPPSDDTMTDRIFVRVSKETIEKLDECTRELDTSRSDVVRKGIDMMHYQLKK